MTQRQQCCVSVCVSVSLLAMICNSETILRHADVEASGFTLFQHATCIHTSVSEARASSAARWQGSICLHLPARYLGTSGSINAVLETCSLFARDTRRPNASWRPWSNRVRVPYLQSQPDAATATARSSSPRHNVCTGCTCSSLVQLQTRSTHSFWQLPARP